MTERRKATMVELKDLARAVKSYCIFCIRQDDEWEAYKVSCDCKKMLDDFAEEFIITVPTYLYLWNKIDRTYQNCIK